MIRINFNADFIYGMSQLNMNAWLELHGFAMFIKLGFGMLCSKWKLCIVVKSQGFG